MAGSARGRRLAAPVGRQVRPTADRVRQAVCNALDSMGAIVGARVVDLFAGSGALGIETLSRGADSAVFVEPDRGVREVIEANIAVLDAERVARARVVADSAQRHLAGCTAGRYDLAFADPPYAFAEWAELLATIGGVMTADGVIVVESDRVVDPAPGWGILRERRYGSTVVGIHVRVRASSPLSGAES